MSNMKVIVSCGGKFHAFHLAEQLDKRGHLYKLLTTFYSQRRGFLPEFRKDKEKITLSKVMTNIIPELIGKGFNKIPGVKNLTNWSYYSMQLFDNWAKNQIDECDLFVGWSGMSSNALKRAKSFGAITVIERGSAHILDQKEILEDEYNRYGIKIRPISDLMIEKELSEYCEADYISIPSKFARQTYIERGISPERLIQVPYGVNLSAFYPIANNDDIFRVVFVGGLTFRKGVHYLLDAFYQLRLKNAELLLIGTLSPEIKPFLRKYEGVYKYIGTVPHLELYKYLSKGSVFVLPSLEEGLALIIPQAMACGLPIICTTNTGGADIVRDGTDGYIVPIRDVEALKEKITYLYKNEDRRNFMSKMVLKRIQEFTWDSYGEKIAQEYIRLLKK